MDTGQHKLPRPQTTSSSLLCLLPSQEAQAHHQGVPKQLSLGDL